MSTSSERLDRYDAYLRQDPGNAPLAMQAFELALDLGYLERAQAYLDQARAVEGDAAYLSHRQAALLAAQGRWPEALAAQRSLCQRFPDDVDLQATLATLLHCAGEHDAAETIWSELQAGGRLPPHAWAYRLRTLHFQRRLTEALVWAGALPLESQPEAAGVLSLMAVDAGDFAAARHWVTVALAGASDSVEALTARGALALAAKDPVSALTDFNAVLQRRPAEGRVWSSAGIAQLLLRQPQAAVDAFQRATALMPAHIGSWHGLGWAQLLRGDLAAASTAFEHALALDRNFGESHGGVAITHALAGRAEQADHHIELALRLDPSSLSVRYAQAARSGALQRPEAFQRLAERALRGAQAPDGRSLLDWMSN